MKNFFLSLAAIVVVFQVFFNFYVIGINHSLGSIPAVVLHTRNVMSVTDTTHPATRCDFAASSVPEGLPPAIGG